MAGGGGKLLIKVSSNEFFFPFLSSSSSSTATPPVARRKAAVLYLLRVKMDTFSDSKSLNAKTQPAYYLERGLIDISCKTSLCRTVSSPCDSALNVSPRRDRNLLPAALWKKNRGETGGNNNSGRRLEAWNKQG